ncbi:MAG: hypothetical protein ACTHNW_13420 [Mucilaginibacter sp.]
MASTKNNKWLSSMVHGLWTILLLSAFASRAQNKPFNPDTIRTIVIDTPIVNIHAHHLNTQDFINAVLADTGFYQAFRNMKKYSFIAENYIYTYDKKSRVNGKIYRKIKHTFNPAGKPVIEYLAKRDSGTLYKKDGKYELYTLNMFDYIFTNAYKATYNTGSGIKPSGGSKYQSYKDKMKTLIFAPGHRVNGSPFISDKTEIFSPDMQQFYDYQFARGTYLDTIPVYRFRVVQKRSTQDNDVVIKELTTIFDTRTFQILGRYVNLQYHDLFIDLDVQMNMELNNFNGELVPAKITYQGYWDVPFHKTERASFLIVQKEYRK